MLLAGEYRGTCPNVNSFSYPDCEKCGRNLGAGESYAGHPLRVQLLLGVVDFLGVLFLSEAVESLARRASRSARRWSAKARISSLVTKPSRLASAALNASATSGLKRVIQAASPREIRPSPLMSSIRNHFSACSSPLLAGVDGDTVGVVDEAGVAPAAHAPALRAEHAIQHNAETVRFLKLILLCCACVSAVPFSTCLRSRREWIRVVYL